MSEKGIIFCTELIPKILDGTKTVTRRCHKKLMYQPGDVLYLRECHAVCNRLTPYVIDYEGIKYRADGLLMHQSADELFPWEGGPPDWVSTWKSARFMPKWAARPNRFEVFSARMEPLWGINNDDAIREGFQGVPCFHMAMDVMGCTDCLNTGWIEPPLADFIQIWDRLNGKRPGWAWDDNPTIARYEFKEIT